MMMKKSQMPAPPVKEVKLLRKTTNYYKLSSQAAGSNKFGIEAQLFCCVFQ